MKAVHLQNHRQCVRYVVRFAKKEVIITSLTASKARTMLYELLDQIAQTHEPIQITGKRNNAVLLSEEDWNSINETLYLLSIPKMRESIRKGLETDLCECSEDLKW